MLISSTRSFYVEEAADGKMLHLTVANQVSADPETASVSPLTAQGSRYTQHQFTHMLPGSPLCS